MSYPSYTGNLSEIDGDLIVFNHTFEREVIGSRPDMGWWDHDPATTSIEVIDLGGEYGKAVQVNMSAKNNSPRGVFAIGHSMMGTYAVSWDYYIKHASNLSVYDRVAMRLKDSETSTSGDSMASIYMFGSKIECFDISTPIAVGQWYHIESVIDSDAGMMGVYVDGTLLSKGAIPADRPLTHMMIQSAMMVTAEGRTLTYLIDNIEVKCPSHVIQPYGCEQNTVISIGFDDANATVYNSGIAAMRGLPAYTSVITNNVGGPKTMTWSDLAELHGLGWELMSHGVTHERFDTLTHEQAENELVDSKQTIEANVEGAEVKGFIWPGAIEPEDKWQIVWDHYTYAGGTWKVDMNRWSIDQYSTNPDNQRARMFTYLPAAVYGHYGYLNLYSHAVTDEPTDMAVTPTNLADFTSRLIQNGSVVKNPRDYYEAYRNAMTASIEGDPQEFSISYDRAHCNFTYDRVMVELRNVSAGEYVIVRDGERYDNLVANDTKRAMVSVEAGVYQVVMLSEYRQSQIEDGLSPLYAAIPTILVLGILGALIFTHNRMKF